MARAITVRLDDDDYAALERQANQLRVRPGTLARMLVHAGLQGDQAAPQRGDVRAGLARLIERSQTQSPADAVELIIDARS